MVKEIPKQLSPPHTATLVSKLTHMHPPAGYYPVQCSEPDNSRWMHMNWYICMLSSRQVSMLNSIVGGDSPEGRLMNSHAPEIVIYLRTYLCVSFIASARKPLIRFG